MKFLLNLVGFCLAVGAGLYLGWPHIKDHVPFEIVAANKGEAAEEEAEAVDESEKEAEAAAKKAAARERYLKATGKVETEYEFKLNQARVKGLLVVSLSESKEAGTASQMNASVWPDGPISGRVRFNQEMGMEMKRALVEVVKHMSIRHRDWPEKAGVEVAFEEKYSEKDGPSAAVACALLLESMITGIELSEDFAVTGDMNADGSVQPIGSVAAKIRGAARKAEVVALPSKNESDYRDIMVLHGVAPLVSVQAFSIETFEEALDVGRADRSDAIAESIAEFALVQDVFAKKGANHGALLRNDKVREKLEHIVSLAPNHLSARVMLEAASGRVPGMLSLAASLKAIDDTAASIIRLLDGKTKTIDRLGSDDISASLFELRKIQSKLDPRTSSYCTSLLDFGRLAREWKFDRPVNTRQADLLAEEIMATADRVVAKIEELEQNPEVVEELIQ